MLSLRILSMNSDNPPLFGVFVDVVVLETVGVGAGFNLGSVAMLISGSIFSVFAIPLEIVIGRLMDLSF